MFVQHLLHGLAEKLRCKLDAVAFTKREKKIFDPQCLSNMVGIQGEMPTNLLISPASLFGQYSKKFTVYAQHKTQPSNFCILASKINGET